MKFAAWTLALLTVATAGCRSEMTEARRAQNLSSFDHVWETVRDKHYDPKLNGVDWNAVRAELRPKVEKARNDDQARKVMQDMLARLQLSHYAIYSNAELAQPTPRKGFVPPIAADAVIDRIKFGNLPEMPLRVHHEVLPENVGYFYLSIFINPIKVMPQFREAIAASRETDGFILDLRHNPGGIGGMAMGIGNYFVAQPDAKLGEMIQRDGTLSFVLNPQTDSYTKPLAILIDEGSASTSEILAGGLKDLKRARIFGTRSAGMALPSLIEKLPNGDTFQYAVANYISTGGQTLEGAGVTPDEVVEYKEPYGPPDPVIAAAVKWIQSQKENK